MAELAIEHIARIEGHGNIAVKVEEGRVLEVRMDVVEPARFFESMVVGRRYDEVNEEMKMVPYKARRTTH